MKSLIALLALVVSLPAFGSEIESISCVLNSHRYGDIPMQYITAPSNPTYPGGDKILTAVDRIIHTVKGVVREGKKDGQLFATILVDGYVSVSSSIFTPTGTDETELTDYSVSYSIICRAR